MLHRYRQLLPLLLLVICCVSTIVTALKGTVELDGTAYAFALGPKHYGALAAVGAALISYFLAKKYYKYCFALTLLFGLFGIINFTAVQYNAGLAFGGLNIGLNLVILAVIFLTYLLNYGRINFLLFALIKPSDEKTNRIQQEEIEEFKNKFSRKSTEDLTQIVIRRKLVPSAITAAQQLLRERQ
ncbi:hypothetical protein ACFQ48_19205 [Hymenobacter caeli]|uniref:DUF4293 family protein n=1 Tax=Hymenobacter caeli TaxID=2735894 RepID=A0ABX2FV05_9BACT|nr:hypothetical protein [Hymenobacter caeli]NRT21028.1 hypothetical protein [Hymenobacter caeli]